MKINKNIAISDTGFVFNPLNGESFSINPIGVEIINLMKEDKSFDDIMKTVVTKYNVEGATLEKDYLAVGWEWPRPDCWPSTRGTCSKAGGGTRQRWFRYS